MSVFIKNKKKTLLASCKVNVCDSDVITIIMHKQLVKDHRTQAHYIGYPKKFVFDHFCCDILIKVDLVWS